MHLFPIRNTKKSLTKKQRKMNNLIIAKLSTILDESSDDDEIGDNQIFDEENKVQQVENIIEGEVNLKA